ncbi:PRELI domain-containing protein 2-like isoform X1 [Mya arenaria]|uniref:PRELI domain-containing protein 2-like isoform X1 n=1 Tax=Mya arenaria TaxID=6604 RepID=UPI0022E0EE98|nr:PRELI domain-containing protein 2-like isoform X1 [Mya arenaria]
MVVTIDVEHVYKYPLNMVANAHFTKYPSAKEKFVRKIEVQDAKEDHVRGVSYKRSVAYCDNVIPGFLRTIRVLNESAILLEEESWFDKRQNQLSLTSRNLTWANYARLYEKSKFRQHDSNPNWTVFEQHGSIDIHGIGPLGRVIEMFAQRFLHLGVKRGFMIMEDLLKERSGNGTHNMSNMCS